MNKTGSVLTLIVGLYGGSGLTALASDDHSGRRPWKTRDTVALWHFGIADASGELHPPIRYSPPTADGKVLPKIISSRDGTRFVVSRRRGDESSDECVYEMLVWRLEDVLTGIEKGPETVAPWRRLEFRSSASSDETPALNNVRFADGDRFLTFLACAKPGEPSSVYRMSMETGVVEKMTSHDSDVLEYAYREGIVVFKAHSGLPAPVISPLPYPVHFIERKFRLSQAAADLGGGVVDRVVHAYLSWRRDYRAYVARVGEKAVKLEGMKIYTSLRGEELLKAVSPDGLKIVFTDADSRAENGTRANVFILDLMSERMDAIATVEKTAQSSFIWAPDAQRVLIASTPSGGRVLGERTAEASVVEVMGGEALKIAHYLPRLRVNAEKYQDSSLEWNSPTQVSITERTNNEPDGRRTTYEYADGQWRAKASTMYSATREIKPDAMGPPEGSAAERLKVYVREGLNVAPEVVATLGNRTVTLLQRDPLTDEVSVAKAASFSWIENGKQIQGRGLLRLPSAARSGELLPTVVLLEAAVQDQYFPDGITVGSAIGGIQNFLANDIAVLQLSMDGIPFERNKRSLDSVLNRINCAVDALVSQRIADPRRLGIAGFSASGYYASLAVSHPGRYSFAAAMIDDSYTGNYISYIEEGVRNDLYGPFFQAKEIWLKYAPDLNVEQVRTPIMFAVHYGSFYEDQPLGSPLRNNYNTMMVSQINTYDLAGRAVDYAIFPDGAHQLQRPREILAVHQLTTDWFAFWLKGVSPEEKQLSARWSLLRLRQEKLLSTPPAPKGRWQFVPDPVQAEAHSPTSEHSDVASPPTESKKAEAKP